MRGDIFVLLYLAVSFVQWCPLAAVTSPHCNEVSHGTTHVGYYMPRFAFDFGKYVGEHVAYAPHMRQNGKSGPNWGTWVAYAPHMRAAAGVTSSALCASFATTACWLAAIWCGRGARAPTVQPPTQCTPTLIDYTIQYTSATTKSHGFGAKLRACDRHMRSICEVPGSRGPMRVT